MQICSDWIQNFHCRWANFHIGCDGGGYDDDGGNQNNRGSQSRRRPQLQFHKLIHFQICEYSPKSPKCFLDEEQAWFDPQSDSIGGDTYATNTTKASKDLKKIEIRLGVLSSPEIHKIQELYYYNDRDPHIQRSRKSYVTVTLYMSVGIPVNIPMHLHLVFGVTLITTKGVRLLVKSLVEIHSSQFLTPRHQMTAENWCTKNPNIKMQILETTHHPRERNQRATFLIQTI